MYILEIPTEPREIPLSCGVMLTVQPCTALDWKVLQVAAAKEGVRLVKEHLESIEGGGKGTLPATVDSLDFANAVGEYCFTRALGKQLISDWNGPGDMEGNPLPVSPTAIETLFEVPGASEEFLNGVQRPLARVVHEGNA